MAEYLLSFSKFALVSDVLALLIYQLVVNKKTAFTFVVMLSCLLGLSHIGWEIFLGVLIADGSTSKHLIGGLWYAGFAISDFAYVCITVILCNKLKLALDKTCNFILVTYLAFGFIQMLRYGDRYVFITDLLGWVYTNIIPALNLGISASIVSYVLVTSVITLLNVFGVRND